MAVPKQPVRPLALRSFRQTLWILWAGFVASVGLCFVVVEVLRATMWQPAPTSARVTETFRLLLYVVSIGELVAAAVTERALSDKGRLRKLVPTLTRKANMDQSELSQSAVIDALSRALFQAFAIAMGLSESAAFQGLLLFLRSGRVNDFYTLAALTLAFDCVWMLPKIRQYVEQVKELARRPGGPPVIE